MQLAYYLLSPPVYKKPPMQKPVRIIEKTYPDHVEIYPDHVETYPDHVETYPDPIETYPDHRKKPIRIIEKNLSGSCRNLSRPVEKAVETCRNLSRPVEKAVETLTIRGRYVWIRSGPSQWRLMELNRAQQTYPQPITLIHSLQKLSTGWSAIYVTYPQTYPQPLRLSQSLSTVPVNQPTPTPRVDLQPTPQSLRKRLPQ